MSWQEKALWLEKITKRMMLMVGTLGVLVIYSGFFFLLFTGRSLAVIPWFFLVSPWICIYFGLTQVQQLKVLNWFIQKFKK
ncbi:hypothetical protein [Shewanella sp. CG12_big_fil_rev_8_21_14_0_65_47_15]|uniref:hypothetical protein n=1 Tax=Shewanella sp. CG12_big_fil_rev_8_21_14_0_65_47_15 TaxID=1975537 RepID=UPI000CCA3C31|nr:hypothetical protein [Shewanella sp. CG12_big_fil_rev_8_21_14_0_65_47_15]PIW62349.1 MAG: hypothetical protein COW15_03825 [Shewanella sp. CG12_big_fil_rev_8_21_14_0_65_47_15]